MEQRRITDAEARLAADVTNAARSLNGLIRDARRAHLRVDVDVSSGYWGSLRTWVNVHVSMPIVTTNDDPTHDWPNEPQTRSG